MESKHDMVHHTYELGLVAGHELIEDMVASLSRQLERHPGLLQKICVTRKKQHQTIICN